MHFSFPECKRQPVLVQEGAVQSIPSLNVKDSLCRAGGALVPFSRLWSDPQGRMKRSDAQRFATACGMPHNRRGHKEKPPPIRRRLLKFLYKSCDRKDRSVVGW